MLWLYNSSRVTTSVLAEHESIVVTHKLSEHSTLGARLPITDYTALAAAYFCSVGSSDRIYVIEKVDEVSEGLERYVEIEAREASCLLHSKAITANLRYNGVKPGAIVSAIMATRTMTHGLAFGTGSTVGTAMSVQIGWGDMGQAVLDVLASQGLGLKTRLSGTTIYLDVFAPFEATASVGDAYGSATGSRLVRSDAEWRNYTWVLGEGEGDDRVYVIVDQHGSSELREMIVDARDLQCDVLDFAATQFDDYLQIDGHGFVNGDTVQVVTITGAAGLTLYANYFVVSATTDYFKVSLTSGGSPVNITTDGTGSLKNWTRYFAQLTARGAEKLAETRRIEYAEAVTDTPLSVGAVTWYDSGRWSAYLMVTESSETHESGTVKYGAVLGEPPASLRKSVKRLML